MKRGRRVPLEELKVDVMDRVEQARQLTAGEALLAALEREHPERATLSLPEGTRSPRRLPLPAEGGLKTNFDG